MVVVGKRFLSCSNRWLRLLVLCLVTVYFCDDGTLFVSSLMLSGVSGLVGFSCFRFYYAITWFLLMVLLSWYFFRIKFWYFRVASLG